MSLKHYQNLWLKTVFSSSMPSLEGVSQIEHQHLQQWSQAQSIHHQQQQELHQYLSGLLPATVLQMLSVEALATRLDAFVKKYKRIDLQHQKKLEQDLLQFISRSESTDSPHFVELCRYEAALRKLNFYQLPTALPAQKGPRLASWARVLYLGPFFPLVMASLKQGATEEVSFSKWSTRPQMPYLLLQEFKGARLVSLTPLVAECLELCHGDMPWESIVEQVISRHPELALQTEAETLLRVEAHYLQEGILLRSAAVFELG
jgi:hypothetical protein